MVSFFYIQMRIKYLFFEFRVLLFRVSKLDCGRQFAHGCCKAKRYVMPHKLCETYLHDASKRCTLCNCLAANHRLARFSYSGMSQNRATLRGEELQMYTRPLVVHGFFTGEECVAFS